jgi:hypothetical protein
LLPKYEDRDYAAIAEHVFHELCNRDPQSQDINTLANEVNGYNNKTDVANIAEQVLLQLHFIERDPGNNNVRLTLQGRKNCGKGIYIPPSDIQKLRMRFRI